MQLSISVTAICIVLCVGLHLTALRMLWRFGPSKGKSIRDSHIAIYVLGCIVAHIIEIALFTAGMYFFVTTDLDTRQALEGIEHRQLELWYYSASFYTSLGVEHTPPSAGLRLFTTCEALTGLILITWTASFLFLLMQETWTRQNKSTQT